MPGQRSLKKICLSAAFVIIIVIMIHMVMAWNFVRDIEAFTPPKSNVAIATLARKPVDFPIWLEYHRKIGVQRFYIRLEDTPGMEDYLAAQKDVDLEVSTSDKSGNNYETLMHRQAEYVNKAMRKAKDEGMHWVFHIDSDEMIHGQLNLLDGLDAKYKCVRMQNAEAVFTENEYTCFSAVKFIKCGGDAPCRSYTNGKGGGRVVDGVELAGPHHFAFNGQMEGENVYEAPFEKLHVLHFDACSLGGWIEKFAHLSKNAQNNVPFAYYKESMDAAVKAYEVYKKHTMKALDGLPPDMVYSLADADE